MQGGGGAPHARGGRGQVRGGSAPSLGFNHSLTYRPWLTGGMSLRASELGQAHSFLEKAEIAVHRKHSSPDHNPDNTAGVALPLGN